MQKIELEKVIADIVHRIFPGFDGEVKVVLTHPESLEHGDYTTNVALQLSKELGRKPKEIAEEIAAELERHAPIHKAEVAGPGFVNIFLKPEFFSKSVAEILDQGEKFGHLMSKKGQTVMYEYTDPNPLKVFHIGHLMSNAIGESLAHIAEASGAKVIRACYQGDVGLHIAKALYGMQKLAGGMPDEGATLTQKTAWLGLAYVSGAAGYEEDETAKAEIVRINKAVYEKSDADLTALLEKGKRWSLAHFEELYKKLGTKFDTYYFESQVVDAGLALASEGKASGVLETSEGALVFKGEQYGLHTRVFVSREGLPTYEAKELGLNTKKFAEFPDLDLSVIITANEQTGYMNVVMKALSLLCPRVAEKSEHIAHGFMFGPGGKKMSSRKGGVISGEELLEEMEDLAKERVRANRPETPADEVEVIGGRVAVAAIKYSILKQGIGRDSIFDREKALSFEGDSGPYLLYTYARAKSVLRKAESAGVHLALGAPSEWQRTALEQRLYWLPEIVQRAEEEHAPSDITTYLILLAQTFNSYYGSTVLMDENDAATPYRLALTAATAQVLHNGLQLLGIETLEKM